uniref:ribosomal protein S17 n=1 Tax=Timspurckia oligopyrenoides TaxID=708627 RepID=UPI001FCDF8D6|nr:ribosomal protein S17 [Timspurckia oligopyrenoides]UNJ17551.1 ribosomal protein S17 [Timspurckia oligopyrenoides]
MAAKQVVGKVVSDKMDKTRVVIVENKISHPKYSKIITRTKRYKVHDNDNESSTGDLVRIEETRPLSKTKRWAIINILSKLSQ